MGKVKKLGILLAVLALLGAGRSGAAQVTLTFEGLQHLEEVLDFYNGGTGSMGSAGPNYGVAFGGAFAAIEAESNFINEPSPVTAITFLSGGSTVMNVASGFTDSLSFWYSSVDFDGAVNIFDGLNGTGNMLATVPLPALGSDGTLGKPFDRWQWVIVPFAGVARSADFSGATNRIGFDDITFTRLFVVPEPGPLALLSSLALAGGGFLFLLRRRA